MVSASCNNPMQAYFFVYNTSFNPLLLLATFVRKDKKVELYSLNDGPFGQLDESFWENP